MRLPSTIIAVLLALLGIGAMVYTAKNETGRAGMATGPQRLLRSADLPIDDVDRVTIKRGTSQALVFQRSGADWNQVQPFAYPMDAYSIRQMAVAARELEVVDRIPPAALTADQSLATLQLAPPAAEITFQWPGGSLTLELGRRSVAGRAYLRHKGDDVVCIVNQRLHERVLDMSPAEWRDRHIFLHAGIESDRIEWQQGATKMTLERDKRKWTMTEPVKTRADATNLDACLQALGRASIADFILDVTNESELANFGLNSPVATLTVTSPGAPARPASSGGPGAMESTKPETVTERLLVGSRTGTASDDRFAMIEGRPVVVRLSDAVLGVLIRNPESLAAPTGSGANPADVKTIVIHASAGAAPGGSDSELRLERDLDKWRAASASNIEVNAGRVQELLDQLCRLRAPNVELREYPRDLEVATVTFLGFDGKAFDTVRIAQDKDKPATLLENGDSVLRIFPQGLKLRLTAAEFGL